MADKPFRIHFYDLTKPATRKDRAADYCDVMAVDPVEARKKAIERYPEAKIAKTKLFREPI